MNNPSFLALSLILAAMVLIPMGDTAGKLLATQHGTAPFFIAWTRFAIGAVLLVPFLKRQHLDARLFLDWRVWLRALFIVGGISSILTALQTVPIATAYGAFFIGPILSFFLSVWLLREPITPAQTALLLAGFAGVVMVVQPGFNMVPGTGFALLSGLFYGSFLVSSRWLSNRAAPRALLLSQLAIGGVVLAPLGLAQMPPMTLDIGVLIVASAVFSMMGNLLLIFAYKQAHASRLAPFVYFQLIAATTYGWLVFDTLPDAVALAGLALLVVSGLASLALRR